jgi:DeoR/GlpR family transcriptional regulator of sugar metabolism
MRKEMINMLVEERLAKIQEIVEKKKNVTIEELVDQLNVSKDTVRRDLIKLEKKGVLKRTYGGAISGKKEALIMGYEERSKIYSTPKKKIAKAAEPLISEFSSVIFDSSTTVEAVIPLLASKSLTAITNSLTHAVELAKHGNKDIKVVGGKLHQIQLFLYGSDTVLELSQYRVDYTLLGVFAITGSGLYIHTEEEGLVKRAMVNCAKKVIAVADSTKMDTTGFFKVCALEDIDVLITDVEPSPDFQRDLQEHGVDLIIAG